MPKKAQHEKNPTSFNQRAILKKAEGIIQGRMHMEIS